MGRFDILRNSNNRIIQESVYKSNFNFEKFEIEDESVKQEISLKEEEIIRTGRQIAKKNLELGKLLYETQQLLSSCKIGTFVEWFKYMGLEKNFVYREIDRWKLFMQHRNPQIAEASTRTIEFIKKHEELEEAEVIEILEDPKQASEKIKSIVKENKTIDEKFNKNVEIDKIDKKIEKLKEQIKKLEEKKQKIIEI